MSNDSASANGTVKTNSNSSPVETKPPLRFLFVSLESLSGDLAWTLKKEGHEVKVYIKAKSDQDVYKGFVDKVERWEEFADWADVIVFDDVEFGGVAEKLRKTQAKATKFPAGASEKENKNY